MWAAPAFDVFPSKASVARGKEIEGRPRIRSYLSTRTYWNTKEHSVRRPYLRTTTLHVEAC